MGETPQKEVGRLTSKDDRRRNFFIRRNNSWSRAFIGIETCPFSGTIEMASIGAGLEILASR